jgi:trehalose 6-phosphate phosphatase
VSETAQLHQPIALFDNFPEIQERIATAAHIALFLDFDGTISGIVPVPSEATLDPEIRSILSTLSARPDFHLSIVSGRALPDVRDRVGLGHIIYVGNHGLEIEGDSTRFREPEAEALLRELRCLSLQLKLALSDTDGLEIEDKGLTLSVHFRRVNEHLHDWVRSVTFSTVSRWPSFTCREGKMVFEIKPQVDWHKGHAVKWILQGVLPHASLPIFIGDDVSDEDAFGAISEGITIKVGGSGDTRAQYLLPDVHAVGEFLRWLDHAKPHASFAYSERAGR